MGKPTAKVTVMTQYHKIFQKHPQEKTNLLKEPDCEVLDFPIVKHYSSPDLVLKSKQKNIQSKGLIHFLKTLGISLEIAQCYFHEVCVYNKQAREKLKTLGFTNEDEGFELINPFFRGTIVLHSTNCLEQIKPYILNYGYKQVYSWMSNDKTGQQAKEYIQNLISSEEETKHKAMNKLYAPHQDLSKWYQHQFQNRT